MAGHRQSNGPTPYARPNRDPEETETTSKKKLIHDRKHMAFKRRLLSRSPSKANDAKSGSIWPVAGPAGCVLAVI
jgi:hypothetical protein